MNIKAMTDTFKQILGATGSMEDKTDSYPATLKGAWRDHPDFYYYLHQECEGGDIWLEFWINRSHYWEYVLEEKHLGAQFKMPEVQRDAYLTTHYCSLGCRMRRPITDNEILKNDFERLRNIVHGISEGTNENALTNDASGNVCVVQMSVSTLLKEALAVPSFQRGYCWRRKNVIGFLDTIACWQQNNPRRNYHMGIIVIRLNDHQNGNACLDIIDGQQRIMSLAMLGLQNGMGKTIPLLNREMSAPNNTPAAQNYLLHARDAIKAWGKTIDFDYLECGVVKLSKDTPPDLAYAFFNHVNASGKRLSDYDLLKSHHLRFVEGDVMSERMANAWDADFGAEGTRATVLHKMLYRLRKWTAGEYFRYAADEVPSHDLFRHFECRHPPILGLVKAGRDDHFDSTVHGGIPFFTFCQRYFDLYREFCGKEVVQDLKNRLANHSNNVLCDAIESMAFLFYAKFGGLHLPEAVYCLAFHLSRLRNEKQIRCAMLSSSPLFRETALLIAHAGDENDVIAALLDESEYYEPTNAGMRAGWYWNDLALFLKSLNKHMVFLPESEEEKAHHPFNRAYRFEAALQKKNQGV